MKRRMSNEELVRKAVISTDAIASAGKLNPKQSDTFIDYVFNETLLGQKCRTVKFRNEKMDIDKIGVGRRVAVPKVAATDPNVRRGVTTSKIQLQPKTVMSPFEIDVEFLELNIEGESAGDHIIQMMAKQTANDLEELDLHGNTVGLLARAGDLNPDHPTPNKYIEDSFLKLGNGFLKQSEAGHVVDADGSPLSAHWFSEALNAMPTKFKRNKQGLVWLASTETEQLWRERLSGRATPGGDAALNSTAPITPFGIPLVGVPLLQHYIPQAEVKTFTGAGSTVSLAKGPIQAGSVMVCDNADVLAGAVDLYIEGTDYTVDYAAGTVTHIAAGAGGSIGNADTVRIGYNSYPEIILTRWDNMIKAMGRDITIKNDEDIYRDVKMYAITTKVDRVFEEVDALVVIESLSPTL